MVYELIKFYKCTYFYEVLDVATEIDAELVYIRGTHALWRGYPRLEGRHAQERSDNKEG